MPSLTRLVANNGGWIHRQDLLDRGWKPHQILQARKAERIELVRRKWLLLADVPRSLRVAAELGGVVTGKSALKKYRLWVPPEATHDSRVHIGLRTDASVPVDDRVVRYRIQPVVERSPRSLVDPLENVLAAIAWNNNEPDAMAVWESAIAARLTTPEELARLPWTGHVARNLAENVSRLSDSGVESMFISRCRQARIPVVQQVKIAGRRVDALIGRRLVVQIDGFAFHSDAQQRRQDIAHDRKLVAMGYTVLRYSYQDIMYDWPRVEREIRVAIAQGKAV